MKQYVALLTVLQCMDSYRDTYGITRFLPVHSLSADGSGPNPRPSITYGRPHTDRVPGGEHVRNNKLLTCGLVYDNPVI